MIASYLLIKWITIDNLLLEAVYKACVVAVPTVIMAYLLQQYNILILFRNIVLKIKHRV